MARVVRAGNRVRAAWHECLRATGLSGWIRPGAGARRSSEGVYCCPAQTGAVREQSRALDVWLRTANRVASK